ncbi:hypothetical protein C5B42_02605 [Candidatus Cerribacteria bacterium 'Amazon FNV 2010 28 9']|uniref:Uncharacterized protein n=1 Tax=Candidatus Cerribacteria bacterium 'Amazon FNV 2010 28 9' TaxID=2081795 RepID=A0A317JQ78_9BACT|nr:MAG: hypothetical protein C5B42_02605 [Candidatus Cerribacteria bacterium 'Amazon FNV 2010 28 9']
MPHELPSNVEGEEVPIDGDEELFDKIEGRTGKKPKRKKKTGEFPPRNPIEEDNVVLTGFGTFTVRKNFRC